jgi:hypothetical protein
MKKLKTKLFATVTVFILILSLSMTAFSRIQYEYESDFIPILYFDSQSFRMEGHDIGVLREGEGFSMGMWFLSSEQSGGITMYSATLDYGENVGLVDAFFFIQGRAEYLLEDYECGFTQIIAWIPLEEIHYAFGADFLRGIDNLEPFEILENMGRANSIARVQASAPTFTSPFTYTVILRNVGTVPASVLFNTSGTMANGSIYAETHGSFLMPLTFDVSIGITGSNQSEMVFGLFTGGLALFYPAGQVAAFPSSFTANPFASSIWSVEVGDNK